VWNAVRKSVVFVAVAALVAASSSVLVARAARAGVPAGAPVDGIHCDSMEGSVFHIHQHLAIFDHGKPVPIPPDVGRPVVGNCLYWIHTHTPDGLIHVEAPAFRTFLLGQFFDVWGQPLSATAVGPARMAKGQLHVFVDGDRYTGDPRKIELAQHTDVTLEAGPPYRRPVPFTDWQGQ
jgi:hypothetical protein